MRSVASGRLSLNEKMSFTNSKIASFRRRVWAHYRSYGRHHLPWRRTHDPYKILVSEVMLQQTQVERVIAYYQEWMNQFPTVSALAAAPLSSALRLWQGLGYNRRAKALHEAAKVLAKHTSFPKEHDALVALPGVGRYTASAVRAFAFNEDVVLVETNIRTAIIHHFFPRARNISDTRIEDILHKALPSGNARLWYAALMDYGSHLKRQGVKVNARSKGYRPQPPLRGSVREARGALLRELTKGTQATSRLVGILGPERTDQVGSALEALEREGLVRRFGRRVMLTP